MSDEKKNNHTLLKVVGATAAAGAAAYAGFSYVVFKNAFDLQHSDFYTKKNTYKRIEADAGEKNEWFAHSVKDDDFLDSYDGLKLHALRVMNHPETHKWMILAHGIGTYSGGMLNYLYEADHKGYNVLAVDLRGCGMSEGRYTGLGWNEHYDIISWINYLVNLDPSSKIALVGINLGAAAVMNAVGDYIPSNVKCAVEDGGFSGIKELLISGIKRYYKVEGRPFLPMIDVYVKQLLHFSMNDTSISHQLSQSVTPMLFMHGNKDEIVPASMMFDNYYSCNAEKDMYTGENAGFGENMLEPDYFASVFNFIDKFIQ